MELDIYLLVDTLQKLYYYVTNFNKLVDKKNN